jgi:hypothetical protein
MIHLNFASLRKISLYIYIYIYEEIIFFPPLNNFFITT